MTRLYSLLRSGTMSSGDTRLFYIVIKDNSSDENSLSRDGHAHNICPHGVVSLRDPH